MILAVLQARVSSSRLPGKVLKPILGVPMILRQAERVRRAVEVDRLLVATSVDPSDDPLAELCAGNGIECFRGSLDDVLDRFYRAARPFSPDHVVRLTGDCPLADPKLIDSVISFHRGGEYDYVSNALEPTFPDGLDVEVCRFPSLEQACREANLPSEREHVTPFLYHRPERFRIGSYKGDVDLSRLRWTVDEPDDFELVTRIYGELYPVRRDFTTGDILSLLERKPDLKTLNTHHRRNEGLERSLEADRQHRKGTGGK
jgi:spore coat polysaccharide biosynthesis protein SpsF